MGKITGFFIKQKNFMKDIYKTYTATIAAAVLLTFIFVIFNHVEDNDFYEHGVIILSLFCAWSFFFESYYYQKNQTAKKRLLFSGVGILVSVILDLIVYYIEETNPKGDYGILEMNIVFFLTFYFIFLIGCALFIIINRQKISFHEYLARVIFGLLRAVGLFLTLYIAVVLLLELFDNLIVSIEYWDVLTDIEIIIAGLIYFPVCLVTLVKTEEENAKFTKAIVTYAFMPCVMIAMAIIYIYIIKIFVTWEIPSNEIFYICSVLFAIGAPIWTMAYAFTKDKKTIYAKMIKYAKYIYAPFICLEIYAVGVRVYEYGITEDRYIAIVFILFQIIYELWELILIAYFKFKKKEQQHVFGKYYEYMILVLVAFAFIGFLFPGINASFTSYLSQREKFKNNKESNVIEACEAYYYLKGNPYGKSWLEKNCTKGELAILQNKYYDKINNTKDEYKLEWNYVYVRYNSSDNMDEGYDISGYNKLYEVVCGYYNEDYTYEDCKSMSVKIGEKEYTNIDITDCLTYYTEIDENLEQYSEKDKIYRIDIDENHVFYVTYINFEYIEGLTRIKELSINGYVLEK